MNKILVRSNNRPLIGTIKINGSKNATLPIMAASLLSTSQVSLHNIPNLTDVHLMSELLKSLGAKVHFIYNESCKSNHTLQIDCSSISSYIMQYKIADKLRASFLVLGPMLSRFGRISTVFPGGCNIGKRPVDVHIKALKVMGASIKIDGCNIISTTEGRLKGKEITFERVSVGATENIIMAATLAEGITVMNNAAIEPEVLNLIEFLKKMGANIAVSKTRIIVKGVDELKGCIHKIIPDRIEAGTYALSAIITDGELKLEGVSFTDISCILNELKAIGANVKHCNNGVVVSRKNGSIKSAYVSTNPYPNFPSDMQPQLTSAMCIADGISIIEENVFANRFTHIDELRKLGANIRTERNKAIISGIKSLSEASLYANDLRSAAALVLASLVATGETIINNSHFLWRGYEAIDEKLNSCGANISLGTYE